MSRKHNSNGKRIKRAFSLPDLQRVCTLPEVEFGEAYDMETVHVEQRLPDEDFYHFKDNGSKILAVAHLDTVQPARRRDCNLMETASGPVIYSGALDDRLGAYIILELLPALGLKFDWLLSVGEEDCMSTAEFFTTEKDYNWVIEFDRGGTDVVMYQYDDWFTSEAVKDSGARVGQGIFTDICVLEHLGVKAFNWGTGYQDYHSPRSHAFLDDTFMMVGHFLRFHEAWKDEEMVHDYVPSLARGGRWARWDWGSHWSDPDPQDEAAWWEAQDKLHHRDDEEPDIVDANVIEQ